MMPLYIHVGGAAKPVHCRSSVDGPSTARSPSNGRQTVRKLAWHLLTCGVLLANASTSSAFTTPTPYHASTISRRTTKVQRLVWVNQQHLFTLSTSSVRSGLPASQTFSRVQLKSLADTSHDDTPLEGLTLGEPHPAELQRTPLTEAVEAQYSYQEAIQRTAGWVGASLLFGTGLWVLAGAQTGQEFFAGYLVEQSLSVDNLFVFLLLFEYFKVPLRYQNKVLNWGIYSALVLRAVMIGVGSVVLQNFRPILLVFAAILVYSSAKFFFSLGQEDGADDPEDEDPSENPIVKFSRSLVNASDQFDGDRFFTVIDGVRQATPLLICMIAIEISDIVFAVDSVPAVFGVTENPLVVFTSNMFAIMGLRSLYTVLSKAAADLKYLEPAVALVLGFIGSKMVAEFFHYEIPTSISLGVVVTLLATGIAASVVDKNANARDEQTPSL